MTTTMDAPPITSPPALELEHVSSGYGRTTVLRDVCLTVPAGGAAALLGPNGAGKTTLLLTVSGLVPATSGTIRFEGTDVTSDKPHRRAAAGLCHIPEGRGIFRGLTVRENLVMQAPSGRETESIERATGAFPILAQRLTQTAGSLSGGQQQMLAFAAAYVRNPRLVLVDEASLGLAPIIVDEIFEALEGLSAQGVGLLVVDQFATRALTLASVAYVLRRGAIAYDGTSADLLEAGVFEQYLGSDI